MAASIALLCFLLILHQSSSLVSASVAETCKAASAGRGESLSYEWCVATLSSYPGSGSADTQGLAVIATKLTLAKAKSIESKISNLLKSTRDPKTKGCLDDCSSMYSDLEDQCNEIIGFLNSKRYFDARTYLSAAIDVGGNCETGFQELKVKSPLTDENAESRKLSVLALAITTSLK